MKGGPACKGWVSLCMQGRTVRWTHLGERRSDRLQEAYGAAPIVINTRRVRQLSTASNLDTCAGAQRFRPAGCARLGA
jgi:hypothetical protein